MGGLGLTLSTAKDALLSQRIAIDVVSHNVANVNTPGYSRQTALVETRDPASYAGLVMGRGVSVESILRSTNSFIEARLQERKSDLSAFEQEEVYMNTLQAIFNENSGQSLGGQLSEFWNAWSDLANNPSGISERNILYEKGSLLSQAFNDLSGDLNQVDKELNLSLDAGVSKINELIAKIADLNPQIVSLKVEGNANDLLDKRNSLVTQLSEYIDVKTYENENGDLTVTTGKGYTLVAKSDYYELGFDQNRVMWESSGTNRVDITDSIEGGKLGGWLEIRDVVLPEYQSDLDELAGSIIWEVNKIHSQGVGLEALSEVTGTNKATDLASAIGQEGSGLKDFDKIVNGGTFTVWVYDSNNVGTSATITVDADLTISALAADINSQMPAGVTATVEDGALKFTADSDHTFAFSSDDSGLLNAMGVNTFFTGYNAESMDMNALLGENKALIAAAGIDENGDFAPGDNTNALKMVDLQDQDVAMTRYQYTRGGDAPSESQMNDTLENYLFTLVGSVGIKSQSVIRSREYNEEVVNKLSETRDNISAVSIDEEMTNLIKYQQAYSAAAKLISTADEMFQTLLETK